MPRICAKAAQQGESVMGRSKAILLVLLLGPVPLHAIACFTVWDRADRVVYYGDKPPVDMSRPLHETVPVRFPGGHMVFDTRQCPVVDSLAFNAGVRTPTTSSPLLTEERTARAMNVPFRKLERGVVLVQQQDAKMQPGFNIVPAFRPPAHAPFQPAPPMVMPPQIPPQFEPYEAPPEVPPAVQQQYRRRRF